MNVLMAIVNYLARGKVIVRAVRPFTASAMAVARANSPSTQPATATQPSVAIAYSVKNTISSSVDRLTV
jgi:hypothetical protein